MATKKDGEKSRTHTLSIFLMKTTHSTVKAALKPRVGLKQQSLSLTGATTAELWTRSNPDSAPRWARFFDGANLNLSQLKTRSAAGLLFIPRKKRLFAIAFGGGRHDLNPGSWEESFGLKVTANSIDPARIRSIDTKTFEATTRHARVQTSEETETLNFGIDKERDLLRALTGTPDDPSLGVRLAGLDSLSATVKIEINALPALLDRYLKQFASDKYKEDFGWIDHVAEVRDAVKREQLDKELEQQLQAWTPSSASRIWLVPPAIVDWTEAGHFTFARSYVDPKPDLHLKDLVAGIGSASSITIEGLKRRKVILWNLDGDQPHMDWSAYSCLYAEIDLVSDTYLLTAGQWYRLDKDFVKSVRTEVKRLLENSPKLPKYQDKSEAEFNARLARENATYVLLDRELVRFGGGKSAFEFCDLASADKDLIHVKRYGGSAPLSHLFAQGENSAQLWMGEEEFRKQVAKQLPKALQPNTPNKRPAQDEYRLVYAVVSRSSGSLDQSLPFFSCLSLKRAAHAIRSYGMRVCLTKVEW